MQAATAPDVCKDSDGCYLLHPVSGDQQLNQIFSDKASAIDAGFIAIFSVCLFEFILNKLQNETVLKGL